ncbi:MAG: fatty acid desaturase [Betaproteobacteria bacterium]|nr:fatty acid desaturase [Betaproteobacteria bacterium]
MFEALLSGVVGLLSNGLWNLPWWGVVLYTLVTTHITIAAVTIFLHRAQAHRALDLGPVPSHFFRFWLWVSTGMVTKEWVAIHRKHHAKCETVDDPHSPQTRGIRTVLLQGAELYKAEAGNTETVSKFGHGTPDDWLERNLYSRFTWQGVGLMLVLDWALFGAIGTVVWTVQMLWIPVTAAGIINGLGHWSGYRNFASKDASTNVLPWGIIIGGEELHNNHHTYPTSAKLSVKPFEFDIGWGYIRAMELIGWAKVRKLPPEVRLGDAKPLVDAATLQAVITHRYDVMARYARELKRTTRREIAQLKQQAPHAASEAMHKLQALRASRRWFKHDADMLGEAGRASLDDAARVSPQMAKLLAMREELRQVWERSNASAEQLLEQLRDWCKRAEDSGIASLQALALRMRSYA